MEFNLVRNSSTLAHDAIKSIYGMYLSEDKVITAPFGPMMYESALCKRFKSIFTGTTKTQNIQVVYNCNASPCMAIQIY